ncbi:hypothetical protein V6N11_026428 [Hibiscus sabdariffa]|uniref:Uncharacterized protein n=1 Tax=Hibiscus sabdariffa TaxID=183260 RepID=A0ABR2SW10_9ROSI
MKNEMDNDVFDEAREIKALLEAILGQLSSSNEILDGSSMDGVTLKLVERVEENSIATTSIEVTALKLDLKMNDMCMVKIFDEMNTRDDEVKVDKHIDVVWGGLNKVQNLTS